jgi:hypothetical protein
MRAIQHIPLTRTHPTDSLTHANRSSRSDTRAKRRIAASHVVRRCARTTDRLTASFPPSNTHKHTYHTRQTHDTTHTRTRTGYEYGAQDPYAGGGGGGGAGGFLQGGGDYNAMGGGPQMLSPPGGKVCGCGCVCGERIEVRRRRRCFGRGCLWRALSLFSRAPSNHTHTPDTRTPAPPSPHPTTPHRTPRRQTSRDQKTLLPLTVAQIFKASQNEPDDQFRVDGMELHQVRWLWGLGEGWLGVG